MSRVDGEICIEKRDSMDTEKKSPFSFRMRNLPKPEYMLLKQLKERYQLDDDMETVVIALRLWSEVLQFGSQGEGKAWVVNVINTWRGR